MSYLLPSVMHHTLSVFEHFLPPKLEEVRRIGIEFQAALAVLPEKVRKLPIKATKHACLQKHLFLGRHKHKSSYK